MPLDKDKQKVLIVGVLAVVGLGIGAFQFLPKSEDAPAPKAKTQERVAKASEPAGTQLEQSLSQLGRGVRKDPFAPGELPLDPNARSAQSNQSSPQALQGGPRGLSGRVPPMDPMGSLPPGGAQQGVGLQPSPAAAPTGPIYRLAGVINGDRPVAVIRDGSDNERLVAVGSQIDAETRLLAIERGRVVIQHRGKRMSLTLGGNDSGK